ncbi:MAG: hypothetical protein EBZ91_12560, partial [Gammaproteobacteria bacterium]|nr:hypothetical protein [Gammaproteobacteria bacterium]
APEPHDLAALHAEAVAATQAAVRGHERDLAAVVRGALPAAELDARTCLAAAALATAAGGCGDEATAAALARALQSCAASLVAAHGGTC